MAAPERYLRSALPPMTRRDVETPDGPGTELRRELTLLRAMGSVNSPSLRQVRVGTVGTITLVLPPEMDAERVLLLAQAEYDRLLQEYMHYMERVLAEAGKR